MALSRIYHKIFGLNANAGQIGKFGSLAAGTPETTSDPAEVQSLSNWLEGWFAAVLGNNSPAIEDRNAVDFEVSYQLGYIFEKGVPEWDEETTYELNSFVQSAGIVYVSKANTNLNNAVTDGTWWKKYSTTPTGAMLMHLLSTLPDGFIWANATTIGDATSGATGRANADTEDLFTAFWNDYSDTICPVSGGRGANAAADFAAHKTIGVPDYRGRGPVGKDNMGGAAAAGRVTGTTMTPDGQTLGASGGTQTHTLVSAEMPSHSHTQNSHTHTGSTSSDGSHQHSQWSNGANGQTNPGYAVNGSWILPPNSGVIANQWQITGGTEPSGTHTHSFTTNSTTATNQSTGGDGAHLNMQPSMICNFIIKL